MDPSLRMEPALGWIRDGPGCSGHFPPPSPGDSPTALLVLQPSARNRGKKRIFPPAPAPLQPGLEEFESTVSASPYLERWGHPAPTRDGTEPPAPCAGHGQTLKNIWAGKIPSSLRALLLAGRARGARAPRARAVPRVGTCLWR